MLAFRGLVITALLALAGSARAEETDMPGESAATVRPHYVGASFAAQAGMGMGGYNLVTVGGDVFSGYRFSRWVSLEGFFGYRFATGPSSSQEAVGAMCVGAVDHWRTNVLGARVWLHALHLRSVDVSIAPSLAAGAAFDAADVTTGGGNPCRTYAVTGAGWTFDGGLDFSVEVRPAPWLGLRAMLETSIDLGESGYESFGVASISGWVGPVIRL